MRSWPTTPAELEAAQLELAERAGTLEGWRPPAEAWSVGGVFVAFSTARATAGSGRERGWAAAVLFEGGRSVASGVVEGEVRAGYAAGYLALREGPLLEEVVRSLPSMPDLLLVNASGRDHPRRAGVALHLGAALDVPTVGVTDRPLVAEAVEPPQERGAGTPLILGGVVVGYRLRTRCYARPVCAHAAWRTDPEAAREVVMASVLGARTPEPLRLARFLARSWRARDEGRTPPGWFQDLAVVPRSSPPS